MKTETIKELAINLEMVIKLYSKKDADVEKLADSLEDLIKKAKSGSITGPVNHVPGERWFQEGDLAIYPDLEAAYSKFKLALTMESEDRYKDLRDWAEKRKNDVFGER